MKLPVVLQSERSECGLACLAMVAGFYGYRSTLREFRSKFRHSLRGTTLRHLRDCGASIGLNCRGVRLELDELERLRTPAIMHWELNHFVVLKSKTPRGVTVVDPALGQRRLTLEEVALRFTGVALEISPAPAFQKKENDQATVKLSAFLPALRGLGSTLAAVLAMTVLLQLFALAMPLQMQFTVDQGIRQGDMNLVLALAVGFGLLAMISAATTYLRSLLLLYVGNTSSLRLVGSLAHHLLRLPDSWFSARHTGDVLSRFASVAPIRTFLMTGAFAMLVDAFMAIGALALLLIYAWDLTLVICAFLVLFAGMRAASYGPLRNLTHESIAANALESSSFIENVQRSRAIKLLGAETDREDTWGEHYVNAMNAGVRLGRFGIHLHLAGSVLGNIERTVLLLLGAYKVIKGEFTLGMLFAFSSYGSMFSSRAHAVIGAVVNLRMLKLHQERIADIGLEEPEIPVDRQGTRVTLRGRIQMNSVSFTYSEEEGAILDQVDLDINAGEIVAITGDSGKGKTTLIKLLTKLLVPTGGEIRVDGIDLRQLDTVHYRRQLGVVMQDDDLFSGSLLENIAARESQSDLEGASSAARLACIHAEIERMPMQYQTLVGHMGSTLSGGQKQRVMIARAVYRMPNILLLDEATAHLNDDLQEQILDNLSALGITILAVTHDPRVVAWADRHICL